MFLIWGMVAVVFVMLDVVFAQLFGVYLSLGALTALLAGYAEFNVLGQFGMFVSTSLLLLFWLAPKINRYIQRLLLKKHKIKRSENYEM